MGGPTPGRDRASAAEADIRFATHNRRRHSRNPGLLVVLLAFVALLFWVTIAKMGSNAGNPWG